MHVNEVKFFDVIPIDSYEPGFFRVGGKIFKTGIVCSSTGVSSWNGYKDFSSLNTLENEIDVLFLGTGHEICHTPEDFRNTIDKMGFNLEIMSPPSA